MIDMIGGQMIATSPILNPLGRGLVPRLECGMIMTELDPLGLCCFWVLLVMFADIRNSDYIEYRGRPVSPPRYPPDYGRAHGNNSPSARYRFVPSTIFLRFFFILIWWAPAVGLRVLLGLLLLPMKGIRL